MECENENQSHLKTFLLIKFSKVGFITFECESKSHFCYYWHFWTLDGIFEIKMIKKICLGVIRFEIGGLQGKLWRRTWSNQLLKILLIKKFSNDSDFHFHIPIHEILDQKSLYGRKNFISEKKKTLLKFLKKFNFFQNHYRGATVEELFAYFFGIYINIGYNNPSILTPLDSVDVAS